GPTVALADPQQLAKLMRRLHRHDWVVYAKPAFGGPLQVLRYLGRYTHRVAISNHRLLAFDQELVTFRWKDYAHGGKQGKMTLLATEFLRRFFLHVLPRGHRDACPSCGHQAISYNSCRNRHCPKCQTQARERWLAARERELLTTSYFHVVFTVPHELNVLALENPRLFYDLLFTASAQTLLEIAIDRKHLGAEIGVIGILHTWGQNLLLHPHIPCVIPASRLSPDKRRCIRR